MHRGAFCFRCRVNKEQIFHLLYFWFYGGYFVNHNTVKFVICVVLDTCHHSSVKAPSLLWIQRPACGLWEHLGLNVLEKGSSGPLRKAFSATGTGHAHWPKVLLRARGPGGIHGGLNTTAGGHRKSSAGTQGSIICLTSLLFSFCVVS